jgi:hypothetical protein
MVARVTAALDDRMDDALAVAAYLLREPGITVGRRIGRLARSGGEGI